MSLLAIVLVVILVILLFDFVPLSAEARKITGLVVAVVLIIFLFRALGVM